MSHNVLLQKVHSIKSDINNFKKILESDITDNIDINDITFSYKNNSINLINPTNYLTADINRKKQLWSYRKKTI